MIEEHTPGALRAAEIITGLEKGSNEKIMTTFGNKTIEGVAAIIDRETAAPDMLAALIEANEIINMKTGTSCYAAERTIEKAMGKTWAEIKEARG